MKFQFFTKHLLLFQILVFILIGCASISADSSASEPANSPSLHSTIATTRQQAPTREEIITETVTEMSPQAIEAPSSAPIAVTRDSKPDFVKQVMPQEFESLSLTLFQSDLT